ncbi:putative mannan endo-1,6-alpha-mannosidase [Lachnellula subtilissima]|uniref:mannan endo-1,6-alpha-mannosidase n=1 Tax=Lachnellula subtilissima TaxID=602034 RepID=A0A8H8RVW4_9HELO|nr:putative mannan endo-1,6-alpha-mannosidase [Lachnellula subtilissima]
MEEIGLIDQNYNVYDNSEATKLNCTKIDHNQWSYNAATMLMGASTMYNYTNGDPVWRTRTQGLIDAIALAFFPDSIMKDICEQYDKCNTDEHSFKAYLSRWMGQSTQMAPFIYNKTIALLKSSAMQQQRNAQVVRGARRWFLDGTWDGSDGVGQQMAALEAFQSTMVQYVGVPLTNSTGGTSISNPTAGHNSSTVPPAQRITPPTKGDKAGAWVLTAFIAVMAVWACPTGAATAGAFHEKISAGMDVKGKGRAVGIGAPQNRWVGAMASVLEEERGSRYRRRDHVA